MPDCWVVNASPVIALAKVGHLDLLDADAPCIVLPQSVADEIRHGPDGDPARQALDNGWGGNPVTAAPDPLIVEWGLGAGETAVLSIARRKHALAVIDDGAARAAARAIGIPSIGTLGIVLRARRADRIPSAVDLLRDLRRAGLRLGDKVIREALARTTDEVWP